MNTHTGICVICGYTTNMSKSINCPYGHWRLFDIGYKIPKLFVKHGQTNQQKLDSFRKNFPQQYNRAILSKLNEISYDFDPLPEHLPKTTKYGYLAP